MTVGNFTRIVLLPCILYLGGVFNVDAATLRNQLKNHPSPYLEKHASDPVAWQKWDKGVLKKAQQQGKLIFISSGYFSCHWCHVMQRESFKSSKIAKLLNSRFIPVKVDRELNPALDRRLIKFTEQTRGSAGWPLNVFLTPNAYPLFGTVYASPTQFYKLLRDLDKHWKKESGKLKKMAKSYAEFNKPKVVTKISTKVTLNSFKTKLLKQALIHSDELSGGFGSQSKFPMVPQLIALLDVIADKTFVSPNKKRMEDFVYLTLNNIQSLGLHDLIGNGFFRYTVDPNWEIPHFEKMLYDNALLSHLFFHAYEITGQEDYLQTAKETLSFLLKEFSDNDGLLVSSFSAINERNEEGGGYLWTENEITTQLSDSEKTLLVTHWRFVTNAELDKNGALPIKSNDEQSVEQQLKLQQLQAKMLLLRQQRWQKKDRHPVDTKKIAAWNALVLSAIAKAVSVTSDMFVTTLGLLNSA